MDRIHIALIGCMACAAQEKLAEKLEGVDYSITSIEEPEKLSQYIEQASTWDVIVGGPITKEIAGAAKNLKLFHVFRGGTGGLGLEYLPEHVQVANTYHHGHGIAEFVVMAMLMLPRDVYFHDYKLRRGQWDASAKIWGDPPDHETLVDKTVLIVGAGHIGSEVGKRLQGFGVHRIGVSRDISKRVEGIDYLIDFKEWHDYLPVADVVVASCRLTPETANLFSMLQFEHMKDTAYFINVSQAKIANEKDLYYALRDRHIAGAAIDTWYRMPKDKDEICFPSEYPFHVLTNVIMSPCRVSWTKEMLERRVDDVSSNIKRLSKNEKVLNLVR